MFTRAWFIEQTTIVGKTSFVQTSDPLTRKEFRIGTFILLEAKDENYYWTYVADVQLACIPFQAVVDGDIKSLFARGLIVRTECKQDIIDFGLTRKPNLVSGHKYTQPSARFKTIIID